MDTKTEKNTRGVDLNVPWDKIKKAVEEGGAFVNIARLYGISSAAIRMHAMRNKWMTPAKGKKLGTAVAEVQITKVAESQCLTDQLEASKMHRLARRTGVSLSIPTLDVAKAIKTYRHKGVEKLSKILDATIIAPPRNWRDFEIADKMMRRLLGLDEPDHKFGSVVQLQVVNERLGRVREDIVEGTIVEESVPSPTLETLKPEELRV